MNLQNPAYLPALKEIARLCSVHGLTPQFWEPETPPGPRHIYSHIDLISQLIEKYKLQIQPDRLSKWRALSKASGNLSSFPQMVWILCTDGTVAWFVTWSGEIILGELDNFTGPVAYWEEDDKLPRELKQVQAHQDRMEELLEELLS